MTEAWYWNPGDHYILDDMTGFKRRASKCRLIPSGQTGNLYVELGRHYEVEHPQDFVQGIADDQTVPIPRSRQVDQFRMVSANVGAPAATGATSIDVVPNQSNYSGPGDFRGTYGMSVGDTIQIMLDNGENFTTTIASITGATLGLSTPLPSPVGQLVGDPPENLVLDLTAPVPPLNWPKGQNNP